MNNRISQSATALATLVAVLCLLAVSCSDSPTQPGVVQTDFSYELTLATASSPLKIVFTANTAPGAGHEFVLPFHYYDNPVDSFSGSLVTNLVVIDALGDTLDTLSAQRRIGPLTNTVAILPSQTRYPVTFTYGIDPTALKRDTLTPYTARISTSDTATYLIGAYAFILPFQTGSLEHIWRRPMPYRITVRNPGSVPVFGLHKDAHVRNTYELLFIQLSAGRTPIHVYQDQKVRFTLINHNPDPIPSLVLQSVSNALLGSLQRAISVYGPIGVQEYTLVFNNLMGGLEGTFGFTSRIPAADTTDPYGNVIPHEVLHHFIGIRCGDYDDPWWKEGVTTYLGGSLAVRLGLYGKQFFRRDMLKKGDYSAPGFNVALSDPVMREMFYRDIHGLAYGKGARVSMIMDRRIRQATANRVTFESVTADLVRDFDGGAFHRSDLEHSFSKHGTAASIHDILSTYVDAPGADIADTALQNAFGYLDSVGAFDKL